MGATSSHLESTETLPVHQEFFKVLHNSRGSSSTMTSSSADVDQEVLCPICIDYLTDPVTLYCGHNYCLGCISSYCDIWDKQQVGGLECPVCKARIHRGNFSPNWQLANIVEKIKLQPLSKGERDLCKRHKERLHLFCKEDEELVRAFCALSPEHKSHTVVPKEEAAQEYEVGHPFSPEKTKESLFAESSASSSSFLEGKTKWPFSRAYPKDPEYDLLYNSFAAASTVSSATDAAFTLDSVMGVEEEVMDPFWMEHVTDRQMLEYGHIRWPLEYRRDQECPTCRTKVQKRNKHPSQKLAKATEKSKHLELNEQGKGLCKRHNRKLLLFCREDKEFLCGHCMLTSNHMLHTLVDKKEAEQEYKASESWRKAREKILEYKAEVEKESQDMLKSIEMEMQKTMLQFQQLHQFLLSQEQQLLIKMGKVKEEIAEKRHELLEELFFPEWINHKMEKDRQPASKLLQNVSDMWPRYKEEPFEKPAGFPLALKWRIWELCDINPFLVGAIKQFKDTVLSGLEPRKANVTLDPNTAHPQLVLSTDYKSASWREKRQDLSPKAERFDVLPFVLGREGFTTGIHFWEVLVESERNWAVGVARKSVRRKDMVPFNPERGIWAVGNVVGYGTLSSLASHHMSLSSEIKKIRVTLNCEGGHVAFHDADTAALIFAFSAASFSGETLHPFFYILGKASLRLSPEGSQKGERC